MKDTGTRRRMTTDARRDQLLRIGARLFADMPYDDVSITAVADLAGVSRGLLYHYFPTKQDFAIAVTQAVCVDVFAAVQPQPGQSIEEQARQILAAYLTFAEQHEDNYRAMHTSLIADPKVRELRRQDLERHERRVLAAIAPGHTAPPLVVTAVRAWLAFVVAAVLDWLAHRATSRESVVDLCVSTLMSLTRATPQEPRV